MANIMEESQGGNSRKVCFFSKVRVKLIESSVDFSEQQKRRSWYSDAEIDTILLRCFQEAGRLESPSRGDVKPKRRPCSRGLEGLTTEGNQRKVVAVDASFNAVMDEQDSQWENDREDYYRLAIASRQVTKRSMVEAIERAVKDEKAARKIYRFDQQKKAVRPPMLPKRRLSRDRDNLRFAHHVKISSELVQRT